MADNQTNLAIKGIIAIKAMSKMSLIVNQTHDVDKYSVRAGLLDDACKIDWLLEYSCESLCPMEEPCTDR